MNEPMSDSYKKEVEEFKKWADNSLEGVKISSKVFLHILDMNDLMNLRCHLH
jgi:hypothetical protein